MSLFEQLHLDPHFGMALGYDPAILGVNEDRERQLGFPAVGLTAAFKNEEPWYYVSSGWGLNVSYDYSSFTHSNQHWHHLSSGIECNFTLILLRFAATAGLSTSLLHGGEVDPAFAAGGFIGGSLGIGGFLPQDSLWDHVSVAAKFFMEGNQDGDFVPSLLVTLSVGFKVLNLE